MATAKRTSWPSEAPKDISMGVVSRRIFQTPLIKWIYPARIRDRVKNDVVFIGETFVQLKEWDACAKLFVDVASLDCFSSHISGVAVLGERRTSEELIKTSTSASTGRKNKQPPQMLVLVLGHHQLAFVTTKPDEAGQAAFRIHSRPTPTFGTVQETETHIAVDAHARAMAFSNSNKFIVLYGLASTSSHSIVNPEQLIENEVVLPIDRTILNMEFIHPLHEDSEKVILLIHAVNDGKFEFDIFMWDFGRLINAQSIKFHRYPLGKSHGFPLFLIPLKSVTGGGYFVVVEEENMLLYRLSTSGSVELTCNICLREDSLDELKEARDPAVSVEAPLWTNWARPIRNPDLQHEVFYLGREDGLFKYVQIGRSKPKKKLIFEIIGSGCKLDCNIDTAMAVLESDQALRKDNEQVRSERQNYQEGYLEALVVASNSGDGGVYEIDYRRAGSSTLSCEELIKPHRILTIPNWAPLHGVAVKKSTSIQPSGILEPYKMNRLYEHEDLQDAPERMFTINGDQPNGAVCEIRHGFSVPLSISKFPEERRHKAAYEHKYDLKHCNAVWTIGVSGYERLMLFSYPWRSVLARIDENTATLSEVMLFDYDEATLDAQSMTVKDPIKQEYESEDRNLTGEATYLVCVCPTHVRLLGLQAKSSSNGGSITITEVQKWDIPNSTLACFGKQKGEFLIAVPKASADVKSVLELKRIELDMINSNFKLVSVGTRITFMSEVSAMTFVVPDLREASSISFSNYKQYFAIGTTSGTIHVGHVWNEFGMDDKVISLFASRGPWSSFSTSAIISIAALQSNRDCAWFYMLCGFRVGVLQVLCVRKENEPDVDSPMTCITSIQTAPGSDSVRVMRDPTRVNCGFVYSENYISLVEFQSSGRGEPLFSNVWFTDVKDQTFSHGNIDALTHSTDVTSDDCLSGCLIAVSGGAILAGKRSNTPQASVVRRPVPGTPRKIMFSKQLNNLVIATTVSKLCSETNHRYSLSTLFRMNPDIYRGRGANQQEIDEYEFGRMAYRFPLDERVLDLMEIFLREDKQVYHFIVATTIMLSNEASFGNKGRICFFHGEPEMTLATKTVEAHPVYAINQTSGGALIYCCGHELNMRVYDAQQKKFIKHKLDDGLLSPGVEIAMLGELIIITTQLHSVIVFRLDESKHQVEKVFTDSRPREGISNLCSPERDLVMMSCKPNRVAGFHGISYLGGPDVGQQRGGSFQPVFDVVLATGVTQVVSTNLQPCWRRHRSPGLLGEKLFGTATDGSLFSFSLLDRSGLELLHFVELMCLRDARVCPFPPPDAETRRNFGLTRASLKDCHVDGQVLLSLLKMPNPEQVLGEMLDRQPPPYGIHPLTGLAVDFPSVTRRKERFRQLARPIINGAGHDVPPGPEGVIDLTFDFLSPAFFGVVGEIEGVISYLKMVLRVQL